MITSIDGEALACQFMAGFAAGFGANNHRETMKGLFANEFAWSWSDGTSGEGSVDSFMETMEKGWGKMVNRFLFTRPLVTVDTDQSRIVVGSECVFDIAGADDLLNNKCVMILKLDDNNKVARWSGIWDPNNKKLVEAFANKTGQTMPIPEARITYEEGRAFADAMLNAWKEGLAKNDLAKRSRHLFADTNLSWDWSDGTKGEGTFEELMTVTSEGWEPLIGSCLPSEPIVAVDTNKAVVALVYPLYSNITGGLKNECHPVLFNNSWVMHLDPDTKKCVKFHAAWDNNNPDLKAAVAAVAAVSEKLKTAAKVGPPSEWQHSGETAEVGQ